MRFILHGVANDYLGKALSGGEIVVIPPVDNAVAIGNVCIYGGTSGYLFVKGRAGERFAVRNSGVFAVIEGAGDHCMEYMTGGICVVAGSVGKNLGAGMTGGIGFVMWSDLLPRLINSEWIFLKNIDEEEEFKVLERLLYLHAVQTGSDVPKKLLAEIDMVRVVVPKEFQKYKSNFLKDAILKIERDFADFLPPASKGISITQNQ
jgi:glutamate synthase domain-containing protein 3